MSVSETVRPHKQEFVMRGIDNRIEEKIDEIRSMKTIQLALSAGTQAEIYEIPTGKKFVVKTIILFNDEASATTYIFYDSTDTSVQKTYNISVGADADLLLTKIKGLVFETTVQVLPSQYTNGGRVTLGGYLVDA